MGEGQNDLSASSIFKNSFHLRSFICQGIKFGGGTSYMPSVIPLPSDDDSVKSTTNAPYALCNSSHRAHCPGCWGNSRGQIRQVSAAMEPTFQWSDEQKFK